MLLFMVAFGAPRLGQFPAAAIVVPRLDDGLSGNWPLLPSGGISYLWAGR